MKNLTKSEAEARLSKSLDFFNTFVSKGGRLYLIDAIFGDVVFHFMNGEKRGLAIHAIDDEDLQNVWPQIAHLQDDEALAAQEGQLIEW